MSLKEGDELHLREISPEARDLAELLHHEARTERIFTLIELALRSAEEDGFEFGYDEGYRDALGASSATELFEASSQRALEGYSINPWPKENETPNPDSERDRPTDLPPSS